MADKRLMIKSLHARNPKRYLIFMRYQAFDPKPREVIVKLN